MLILNLCKFKFVMEILTNQIGTERFLKVTKKHKSYRGFNASVSLLALTREYFIILDSTNHPAFPFSGIERGTPYCLTKHQIHTKKQIKLSSLKSKQFVNFNNKQ